MTPRSPRSGVCVHCGRTRYIKARGLCWKCWGTPVVRSAHGKRSTAPKNPWRGEETRAEVEALFAQQMAARKTT